MPHPSTQVVKGASELRLVLGQLVRRLRAEYSFPVAQASVLSRLDREGPQTASALAAAEHVRPQSMAQTLAELETAGLIERRPDPGDGRRSQIELTAEGRDAGTRRTRPARGLARRGDRRRAEPRGAADAARRGAAPAAAGATLTSASRSKHVP